MRFNLIREPAENPIDLLNSYRQQNIMMQKIRVLHTAFDGIKLTNWSDSNRELPNILIGSVCEFEGRLFEAEDNIILTDSDDSDGERFIRLAIVRENQVIDSDSDYLIAELVSSKMPEYDYYNRGFYSKVDGFIKYKYLRLAMKYSKTLGGYVEKKYWNISDLMRAGITFKKHSVSFGVGTHTFNVPDSANTITVHLVSGGGGGASWLAGGWGQYTSNQYGSNGGDSQIIVNKKTIVNCEGGKAGKVTSPNGTTKNKIISPGSGGRVTFDNAIKSHINYRDGNAGLTDGKYYSQTGNNGGLLTHNTICFGGYGGKADFVFGSNIGNNKGAGGGAGSCAIVAINRDAMSNSKQITIIVGAGGKGSNNKDNNVVNTPGGNGQDGSAVVEYFSRG
ncbi:hypothetical protein EPJ70_00945 [Brachyspira aalborgi]|uniref:Glycine-rich domain-containing protein n=1 Tax=Brachyspira aalborgi TaxID=29522 RepID=A0A5C8FAY6_9SPIR|nr:hypothetical protein [Brachyspira aalborgi]TXJ46739.1 hypothetical protein EPJ70_00945 [Brachyspira aalborgi]